MRIGSLALAGFLAVSSLPAADRLELISGGQLDGDVRHVEEAKRPFALIELREGIRVAIPRGQVRRTVESEELARYRQFAAAAGDDAERHFLLAKWCTKHQLQPQRDFHMQRVIALEPDHEQARAALGYVRRRGEWISYAQQQRDRGMVLAAGRWQLPEAVAFDEEAQQIDVAEKKWKKEIARLRSQVLRGGDKGAEAWQALRAIDDPLAARGIGEELIENRSSQPQNLRMLWVDLLGNMRTQAAVEPLIQIGLSESDPVIRERAYEKLENYGKHAAIYSYLPLLKSSKNAEVRAAGRALIELNTPEIKLELVDALVTTHTKTAPAGPEMSFGFGRGGAGGMSMGGGGPKQEKRDIQNPQVLAALKKLEPDVDYQYDEQAWRRHFAAQLTRYEGDLRRDR